MTTPTPTETLFGGADLIITKRDGSTESVVVLQLAVDDLPKLAGIIDDEARQCELYCAKEKGWANLLSNESLETVIAEGERINSDFFARWAQRRLARQEKMMPGSTDRILKLAGSAMRTGSPS